MRLGLGSILFPALALLMLGCGPNMHHRNDHWMEGHHMEGHHGGWQQLCGPEACFYGHGCFSGGAVRLNDGVCQSCLSGKWVPANGCEEYGGCHGPGHCGGCGHCGGKMGEKSGPCQMDKRGPHGPRHKP